MAFLFAWSIGTLATNAAAAAIGCAFVIWQRRQGNQIDWW